MSAYQIRDCAPLVNSSGSSTRTTLTGKIDDAESITIYLSSGTNILSSGVSIIVTPWDPADPAATWSFASIVPTTSMFYNDILVGTSLFMTSGTQAFTINQPSFRGIGLVTSANSITTGTTIAFVTKKVLV